FLAKKAYDAHKESKKLHDVSTETTDKLWDQAESLEKVTDEFDKLRSRANLTNDEVGRMIDIQSELEVTQNPARIADLEKEYGELAEKSGLSNDELSTMIGLNKDIIDQSPNVEKSYTDQGN